MNRQTGFSIVEILVALGIISLITAVSVPNYTKMRRAAKKAEAQSSLGQLYISEKNFYLQHRTYVVDLRAIGAIPEGALTYNVGFNGKGTLSDELKDRLKGVIVEEAKLEEKNSFFALCGKTFGEKVKQCAFTYKKGGKSKGFEPPNIPEKTKDDKEDCSAAEDTFVACAIANLISKSNKSNKDRHDKWSINQYKVVQRECDKAKGECPY